MKKLDPNRIVQGWYPNQLMLEALGCNPSAIASFFHTLLKDYMPETFQLDKLLYMRRFVYFDSKLRIEKTRS